jgi:hypothetical protein
MLLGTENISPNHLLEAIDREPAPVAHEFAD